MQTVICFVLIAALIFEFLTWRSFTKRRRLLVELCQAMMRYFQRTNELLAEMQTYAAENNWNVRALRDAKPIAIPASSATLEDIQQMIFQDRALKGMADTVFSSESAKERVRQSESLFYSVDEFNELQQVIEKCVLAYNLSYDEQNKRIKKMPTALVAKMLRIKPPAGKHFMLCSSD